MHPPDPHAVRAMLARPLQVVAGKGGVGRSTIAAALAVSFARRGLRTLLLEVNSADSVASYLGVASSIDEPRLVLDNLWLCRMTPAGAMREYALMVLKFKALYALVFENKLVKYLLRSIPSLAEFTMAGKTWFHTSERRQDGSPKYDRIIVDAPATGHAITFLSVARTVADIAPAGIMRTASVKMAELIESKESSCLHVATLPEEMPINEGLDIVAQAETRLKMAIGLGFVNRMLRPILEPNEVDLFTRVAQRADRDPAIRPYVAAAQRRMERESLQNAYATRFSAESRAPVIMIPELDLKRLDLSAIEKIADEIDAKARIE